jgi:heme exporter protein D
MYWNNWSDFWNMGGYAFYVWSSFGFTALALAAECWWVKRTNQQARLAYEADTLSFENE